MSRHERLNVCCAFVFCILLRIRFSFFVDRPFAIALRFALTKGFRFSLRLYSTHFMPSFIRFPAQSQRPRLRCKPSCNHLENRDWNCVRAVRMRAKRIKNGLLSSVPSLDNSYLCVSIPFGISESENKVRPRHVE